MTAVTDIVFLNFDGSAAEGKVPAVLRLHPQKGQDPQMELGLSKQQMARLQQAFGTYCLNGRVSQAGVRTSNVQLADGSRVRFSTYGGLDYVDVWPAPVKDQDSLDSGVGILFTDIAAQPIDGYKTEPSPGVFVPTPVVLYFGQATQQWYAQPLQFMIGGRQLYTNPSRRNWVSYTPGVRYCMKGNATLRALYNYTSPHPPFIIDSPTGPLLAHLVPNGTTTMFWYGPATAVEGLESKVLFDPGDYLGPAGGNQTLSTTRVAHPTHQLVVSADGTQAAILDEEKKFLLRYTLAVTSDGTTSTVTVSVSEEDLLVEDDPDPEESGTDRIDDEIRFEYSRVYENEQAQVRTIGSEAFPLPGTYRHLAIQLRWRRARERNSSHQYIKSTAEGVALDELGKPVALMREQTLNVSFSWVAESKFAEGEVDGLKLIERFGNWNGAPLTPDRLNAPRSAFLLAPADNLHEVEHRRLYEVDEEVRLSGPFTQKLQERRETLNEKIKASGYNRWVLDTPVPEGNWLIPTEARLHGIWPLDGSPPYTIPATWDTTYEYVDFGGDYSTNVSIRPISNLELAEAKAAVDLRGAIDNVERTMLLQRPDLKVFIERRTDAALDKEVTMAPPAEINELLTYADEPPMLVDYAESAEVRRAHTVRLVVQGTDERELLTWEVPPYETEHKYKDQDTRNAPSFSPFMEENEHTERSYDLLVPPYTVAEMHAQNMGIHSPRNYGFVDYDNHNVNDFPWWDEWMNNLGNAVDPSDRADLAAVVDAPYTTYGGPYHVPVLIFWDPTKPELGGGIYSPNRQGIPSQWKYGAPSESRDYYEEIRTLPVRWTWSEQIQRPGTGQVAVELSGTYGEVVAWYYAPRESLQNESTLSTERFSAVKEMPWSVVRDEVTDPVDPVELFRLAYAEDPTSGGVVVHVDFDGHLYQSGERKSWTFAFINDVLTPVQSILGLSEDQELRLFNDIPANLVSL